MNNDSARDDLRREMAAARADLARDSHAAVADARTLADWRHHFRAHPWLFCGAAAAVGFLLVPKRQQTGSVAQLVQSARSSPQPMELPTSRSLAATILGLAATFVAKQSLNYLTSQGLQWLELRRQQRRSEPMEEEVHARGPRP
jgi:hypothetical protein